VSLALHGLGKVVFTDERAVYQAEPVACVEGGVTRAARETLQMVYISLCSHHQFTSSDRLSTPTARAARAEQSDIVVPAQYHPRLGVTRRSDLAQLALTTRTLEAPGVPVPVHGVQQEAVLYPPAAPGARLGHAPRHPGDPRGVQGDGVGLSDSRPHHGGDVTPQYDDWWRDDVDGGGASTL